MHDKPPGIRLEHPAALEAGSPDRLMFPWDAICSCKSQRDNQKLGSFLHHRLSFKSKYGYLEIYEMRNKRYLTACKSLPFEYEEAS